MPLRGHSWGIHPSRGHTWPGERVHWGPLTGGYISRRATSPWEGKCISRVSLKAGGQILFWGGHTARGRVPQGSIYGQGHSTTEVTHPRGTQAPCTHVYPVPRLGVPVQGHPPLPDVPPGPHPHGLPPCPVQHHCPATGNQFAVGSSQFRVPTTMGRDNPGDHRRMGNLWGNPEVEDTGGAPLQAPRPHIPPRAMPGWVGRAARGGAPPGHEGVKGPVQLCSADVRYADEAEQVL